MSLPQQCVADTIEVIEAKENAFNLLHIPTLNFEECVQ